LRLVVPPQPLAGPPALGHGLGVSRGVDPIFKRETADPDRREQGAKLGGHRLSSRKTLRYHPWVPPGNWPTLLLDRVLASSRCRPCIESVAAAATAGGGILRRPGTGHTERVTETTRLQSEELFRVPKTRGRNTSTKPPWWPQRDPHTALV